MMEEILQIYQTLRLNHILHRIRPLLPIREWQPAKHHDHSRILPILSWNWQEIPSHSQKFRNRFAFEGKRR